MESDQQAGEGSLPKVPDKVEDKEPQAEMESGTKQGDGEEMSVETSTPINENPQTGETKENKEEKDSESPPKDTAQNETDVNGNVPEGQGQTVQDSVNPLQDTTVATKNHDEGLEQLESEKNTQNDEDVSNVVGQLVENVSQSETDIRVNDEQPQNNETETNAQTNEEARDENLEETIDKNDGKVSEEQPRINENELKVTGGGEKKDSEIIEPSNHIVNGRDANLDERNTDSSTVEVNKNVDNIEDNEAENVSNESRSNEVDHQTNQVESTQNNSSNGDATKDAVDSNENKTVQSDNKVSNDYNVNGNQDDTDEISAMVKPLNVDNVDENVNQTSQDTDEANEVKNNENKSQETIDMMSESTNQDVDKEDLIDDILNTDDGLVDPDIDNIEQLDTTKISEAKDSDLIRIKDDSPNLFDSKEHDRISKSSIADDIDQFLDDEENNDDEAADALTDQLLTQQLPSETKQSPNVEALAYESEYLTRKVQEGRNNEKHLKREIDDKDRKLEDAERKIKDLQIRLIRFARDDEAKDKHVATLEKEMKEINRRLEEVLDEHQERIVAQQQQHEQQNGGKITTKQNGEIAAQQNNKQRNTQKNVTDSKTCVLL